MNKDNEKYIEKRLREEVERAGGLCIKLLPFNFAGLPDRMVLLPLSRLIFVEIKSKGKKPSKIQIIVHKQLAQLGFDVRVIASFEHLANFIIEEI